MAHTLSPEDLDGFSSETILAMSTKERKKLILKSTISSDGTVITRVVVTVKNIEVYGTLSLSMGIAEYNSI